MHWTPYFNPADKKYDPHTDRHQLLQAHVVRIMKVRHKLSHAVSKPLHILEPRLPAPRAALLT